VIDLMAMLFEFILDDRSLPASLKVLIARLQTRSRWLWSSAEVPCENPMTPCCSTGHWSRYSAICADSIVASDRNLGADHGILGHQSRR
jgi:hypothetical protein